MVLKLYGSNISPYTRTVAIILEEKQIPFEFHVVDTIKKKEHKTPEFRKKHPFGQVPYIDDDGFILYESRAIAWYLSAKYSNQGTPLVPASDDIEANALLHQALSVERNQFLEWTERALTASLFRQLFHKLPVNQEEFERCLARLEVVLDVYDELLSKRRYVAGDNLTYVDFLHLTDANLLKMAGSDIMESEKRPNVLRWYNELRARPSWGFNQSSVGGNFKRDHPAVILEEKDKETANM